MTGAAADGAGGKDGEKLIRQPVDGPAKRTITSPIRTFAPSALRRSPFIPITIPGGHFAHPAKSAGQIHARDRPLPYFRLRRFGPEIAARMGGGDSAIFRIDQVDGQRRSLVIIEGKLVGEYVGVADACCTQALASGRRLLVLLRDVTAIDEAGRNLLRRLAARGVRLRGSGVYTSYLLRELTRTARVTA